MAKLIAYNLTGSPLVLAAGNPAVTLPASTVAPSRGPAMNVGAELRDLNGGEYASLQVQVAASLVDFEWDGDPDWVTPGLWTTYAGTNPTVVVDHTMSPYNATYGVILADSSIAAVSINAPSATTARGQFTVKDYGSLSGTNSITIVPNGSDQVEAPVISTNGASKTWVSDGLGNWVLI